VRELQNVIEHLVVLVEPGQPIRPEDVPIVDDGPAPTAEGSLPSAIMDQAYHLAKDTLIAHFERVYLGRLVTRAAGNMSRAARLASIDRTTLYRLMEKHNFRRAESAEVEVPARPFADAAALRGAIADREIPRTATWQDSERL
jgi:DNA-binding NtrC family response regulator